MGESELRGGAGEGPGGTRAEQVWRFSPRPGRAPVRRSEVTLVAVATLLGLLATIWALWPRDRSRLIFSEELPGGRIFACYTDGAVLGAGEDPGAAAPSARDRADFERLSAECEARRRTRGGAGR